jgi:hypothetical protein
MNPANSSVVRCLPFVAVLVTGSVIALGLAPGNSASAAQKTLSWNDDACTYRISFDPAKHDAKRLNNTIRLLFNSEDLSAPIMPYTSGPQEAARIDLRKFDQECSAAVKKVRELELAPLQGLEDYRGHLIAESEDACRFGNIQIRGLRNPSALREYTPASACFHFIDALEGKSDMMKAYREMVDRQCANNASPRRCREDGLKEAEKPDGQARVRFHLITYGWNNCANQHTVRNADTREKLRSGPEKQFRRMFTVRSKCENPG